MADIAVLVAENEGALDALAAASALKIIAGTKRPFDSLATFRTPAIKVGADINLPDAGWVALATVTPIAVRQPD